MKIVSNLILCISMIMYIGCAPSKQEQERQKQQAIQDSIAAVEFNKPVMLKTLEKIEKENPSIAEFFVIPNIANSIKSKYGENYYSFLQEQVKSYNIPSNIEKRNNIGGEVEMYILTLKFETTCSGIIQFQYHINEDDIDVFTNIKVNDDYYSLLNPDGTFALNEGSKWEGKYLENDEFGDPIKDKAFIAVYNSDLNYMNSTYIAVMKGDEDHVRFYYDLPWYPGRFDNNKILSIKIKNKIDGTVRELSNYKYNTNYCILSEEDSYYIKEMCDSNPQISFCIRFEVISYDWFPDSDDVEVCTIDFDNGLAYGLNNAIMAYFYKMF